MKDYNSRTMTVSTKLTPSEKIRYKKISESHEISLSEWIASILNMYQNSYGELRINSIREEELTNEIDKLKKEICLLKAFNESYRLRLEINKLRI